VVLAYVLNALYRSRQAMKELDEFNKNEESRATEELAKYDTEQKPWPVKLIKVTNGIQTSTNLQALDITYGPKVIGAYQGWKIYNTVASQDQTFEFDSVAVKRDGRYLIRGLDGMFLILAPGLAYKQVEPEVAR